MMRSILKIIPFSLLLTGAVVHAQDTAYYLIDTSIVSNDGGASSHGAWGDYDGDGDLDLFVTNRGTTVPEPDFLYRNDGNGSFARVSQPEFIPDTAWSFAASWGDYDNDGDPDLFVANSRLQTETLNNSLYRNDEGTLARITSGVIVDDAANSTGGAWGDYDNDGDLDLYVANYGSRANALYRNEGGGVFARITEGVIVTGAGSSVGAQWIDFDNDSDLDLFVSNDNNTNNALYRNQLSRTGSPDFVIVSGIVSTDGGNSKMAAWADVDGDGDLDLYVANDIFQNNFLYRNDGGAFAKNTTTSAVIFGGSSFFPLFVDYDNDGDQDLYVANNPDDNFWFVNSGPCSSLYCNTLNRPFTFLARSPGGAFADYDNDGDLDLFMAMGGVPGGAADTLNNRLFRNDILTPNQPPLSPGNLQAVVDDDTVTLTWDLGSDADTPDISLTYNLRIGNTPGGNEIMSGHADSTGFRHIAAFGNAFLNTDWRIRDLPPGNYFWSVQTLDGTFTGSAWASERTFSVFEPESQPDSIDFTLRTPSNITAAFDPAEGSPDGYLVIRKIDHDNDFTPWDSTAYSPGSVAGAWVVKSDPNAGFSDTGLVHSTEYLYEIYAYNNAPYGPEYLTPPLDSVATTLAPEPSGQPSGFEFSNMDLKSNRKASFNVSFSPPQETVSGFIAFRKKDEAVTTTPVKGSGYDEGQTDSVGNIVAYLGSEAGFSEAGLDIHSDYHYAIFSWNGAGDSSNYLINGPLTSVVRTSLPPEVDSARVTSTSDTSVRIGSFVDPNLLSTFIEVVFDTIPHADISAYPNRVPADPDTIVEPRNVTAEIGDLETFREYHFRLVSTNAMGPTATNDGVFQALGGAPVIRSSLVTFDRNPAENQAAAVSAIVTGAVPEVSIVYQRNSDDEPVESAMVTAGSNRYEAVIPASFVTKDGLWFRIRAGNARDTVYYPGDQEKRHLEVQISETASFEDIAARGFYSSGIPKGLYQTISLPFRFDGNFLAQIFGEQKFNSKGEPTNWAAFEYNASSGLFEPASNVVDENAYVIYHKVRPGRHNFDFGSATTHPGDRWDKIVLQPGWNLIPWPFSFPDDIVDNFDDPVYELNGGTKQMANRFQPYGGYLIQADSTVRLADLIQPGFGGPARTGPQKNVGWRIRLGVSSKNFGDRDNWIGVHPDALIGYDVKDATEPPGIGKQLALYFENDPSEHSAPLTFDIRPDTEDGYTWDMVLQNSTGEKALTLETEAVDFPQNFGLAVVDISNNRSIHSFPYSFESSTQNRFKVAAGTGEYVKQALAEIEASLPDRFELLRNYPNPFNPNTTIRYALPKAGRVHLTIYNLLGQKVRALVDEHRETGRWEVMWNGTNEFGKQVASGVYFYVLRTPDFQQSRKMLLLR